MDDRQSFGTALRHALYVTEGLILFFFGVIYRHVSSKIAISFFLFWVISYACIVSAERRYKKYWIACMIQMLCSTVLMMGLCLIFENIYLFFFLFFIQWMENSMIQDVGLCNFMIVYHVILTVVLTFFPETNYIEVRFGALESIVSIIIILYAYLISISSIRLEEIQKGQNADKEQSLDDMLRLIEIKCDEARNATKTKSAFLSSMSHEIRTPINAILGMNEMILRESSQKSIHEYSKNINSAGNMLLSLINDILDFSKIESGKMDIVPVNYEISSIIKDLINMAKPRAEKKNLKFNYEINPKIPRELYGDEVRIRQVGTNILTNAIKYTREGEVTLKVDYEQKTVHQIELLISVKDTGIGIRKEDQAKLFNSFQRIDQTENRNIEGTGLGLAITSSFVNMMNGYIGVDSIYGKGSNFYIRIPQLVVDSDKIGDFSMDIQEDIREEYEYKPSFVAPNAKILIVDDNRLNLAVATMLLKQTKIQIHTAIGGMDAIRLLETNEYDAIFLDHMMPDLDGIETLKIIKERKLDKDIPIFALTANALTGAKEKYIDAGFDDYISKPIRSNELEKLLVAWLPEELVQVDSGI